MADNFQVNTGTGPTIATEDIGGVQHQKVRLNVGASGAETVLSVGQAAMSASIPVVIANNQATIPVSAAFTPSGTQNVSVVNASLPVTGSVSVINTLTITGTVSTAIPVASMFNAYVVTTTATNTIIKTSGAHTLYITDMVFSVDVPMNIQWNSATTAKGIVYLATKGGFVANLRNPFICNSAESLTMTPSASGSCSAFVIGYTVT